MMKTRRLALAAVFVSIMLTLGYLESFLPVFTDTRHQAWACQQRFDRIPVLAWRSFEF